MFRRQASGAQLKFCQNLYFTQTLWGPCYQGSCSYPKELEQQSRQNLSTINFTATFPRTSSAWNTVLEKGLHSARSSLRKTQNQILDGADPRRLIKRGYQTACHYFDITEKRILIQQRSLACLSKSVAHILQRELYTMGNTSLLQREAKMTLLHPHLGQSKRQELRNSPFWPFPLFKSELVKMERTNNPFCSHQHNKKRGSYRKRPYGGNSCQSSNQSFSSNRGKPNFRGSRSRF